MQVVARCLSRRFAHRTPDALQADSEPQDSERAACDAADIHSAQLKHLARVRAVIAWIERLFSEQRVTLHKKMTDARRRI
jgi:hypothetical protein